MKRILVHFCLGILILSGIIYASLQALDKMTLHGATILVPNLSSYSIYEVEDQYGCTLHLLYIITLTRATHMNIKSISSHSMRSMFTVEVVSLCLA